MKINSLIKIIVFIATVFALESDYYCQHQNTTPCVWLDGGMGFCFVDSYNNGVVPFSQFGFGAGLQAGVVVDWGRYHIQNESRPLFGMFMGPLEGYVGCSQIGLEFLYHVSEGQRGRLHLWAGGSLQGDTFIMVLPSLSTASTSNAIFGNLCAKAMVQYDFAFVPNESYNLLGVYCKLTLPLVGVANFPGFSYMDDYMSDINLVSTLLSTYQTRFILCSGVGTNVGLRFNLSNGNRIGFSYRWDYMTTRNRGYYRFDNAFHTFIMDFMFKLN